MQAKIRSLFRGITFFGLALLMIILAADLIFNRTVPEEGSSYPLPIAQDPSSTRDAELECTITYSIGTDMEPTMRAILNQEYKECVRRSSTGSEPYPPPRGTTTPIYDLT